MTRTVLEVAWARNLFSKELRTAAGANWKLSQFSNDLTSAANVVRADEKLTICGTGISDSSRFLLAAAARLGHQTAPA